MVNISNGLIEDSVKNIRFLLNYPKLEVCDEETSSFLEFINEAIYNDIKIFKEVVESNFLEENKIVGNINVICEFQRAFNKNNIISIPVEFSQIIGLTDISHIVSYNYDFNLSQKITLDMIFKADVDYERIMQNYIMEEIYTILDKYSSHFNYDIYDLLYESLYICEDPIFYFNNKNLVICVSSFEITSKICNLIEFPIPFKNLKKILSDYALKNIVEL